LQDIFSSLSSSSLLNKPLGSVLLAHYGGSFMNFLRSRPLSNTAIHTQALFIAAAADAFISAGYPTSAVCFEILARRFCALIVCDRCDDKAAGWATADAITAPVLPPDAAPHPIIMAAMRAQHNASTLGATPLVSSSGFAPAFSRSRGTSGRTTQSELTAGKTK
jgi:hypothetical protein